MLPVQFNIAQCAKKPAALIARDDRSFLSVVETGRFTFLYNHLGRLAGRDRTVQCRKRRYTQFRATARALD
jgi:hypothetical protein